MRRPSSRSTGALCGFVTLWLGCSSDRAPQLSTGAATTDTSGAHDSEAGSGPETTTGTSSGTSSASSQDTDATDSASSSGEPVPDPDPQPSAEQWARLQALRYDEGPSPADVTNAWADDDAAAALGQALFFDRRFSGPLIDGDNDGSEGTLGSDGETHRVACSGCHVAEDRFVDTRSPHQQISLAAGWVLRRTPTLLDVGFATLLTWDGRRDAMHNLLFGVVENPREFNSSRLYFAKQLQANHQTNYEAVFGPMPDFTDESRFGTLVAADAGCTALDAKASQCNGRPGDGGIYDALGAEDKVAVDRAVAQASKAIGAYLRRLRCGSSRFDAWLDGDEQALSVEERRGAILFVSKAECDTCHTGPRMTDLQFHNVGLIPQTVAVVFVDTNDLGAQVGLAAAIADPLNSRGAYSDGDDDRLPDSVDDSMLGAFKTPTLRCIDDQPSFMHTGHFGSLAEVVRFFRRGGDPGGFPGVSELHPLDLSETEEADLVAFLETLGGPGPDAALLVPPP